ncbi:hypothetical protein F4824DRAFT_505503 [Ustulina deusta]|nr:hypothetical protein F4824DRAFT_505503 [Ustulina deusta]
MVREGASTSSFEDPKSGQPSPREQSPRLESLRRRTARASASAHKEQDRKQLSQQRRQIKLVSRSTQHESSSKYGTTSSSESNNYSNLVMKVYMDKKLYSIFDRSTKKYIYNSKWDAHKGYSISYSEGKCTAIGDSDGWNMDNNDDDDNDNYNDRMILATLQLRHIHGLHHTLFPILYFRGIFPSMPTAEQQQTQMDHPRHNKETARGPVA